MNLTLSPTERRIVERLRDVKKWTPVHRFEIFGASDTSVSARLRELARKGIVVGRFADGKKFKEWNLSESAAMEALS